MVSAPVLSFPCFRHPGQVLRKEGSTLSHSCALSWPILLPHQSLPLSVSSRSQAGSAHGAWPHTWVESLRQTGQEWSLGIPCLILRLCYHVLRITVSTQGILTEWPWVWIVAGKCGICQNKTKQNKTQKHYCVLKDNKMLTSRKMLTFLRDNGEIRCSWSV